MVRAVAACAANYSLSTVWPTDCSGRSIGNRCCSLRDLAAKRLRFASFLYHAIEYETAEGIADFHAAGRHSHITQLLRNGATQAMHLLYDAHGSTRALLNGSGQVVQDGGGVRQLYSYDAYGNILGFTATPLTTLLYSGEQTDPVTGLQHLGTSGGRDYRAATGTFTTMDSFAGNVQDPLSLHKYLYVHGNPINAIDPTGQWSLSTTLTAIGIGLNIASFTYNAVTATRAAQQGDAAEATEHTIWAMVDLAFLFVPFSGAGGLGARAAAQGGGTAALQTALQLNRAGVNAAAIWGYLTTLGHAGDQLGDNYTFAESSSGSSSGPRVGDTLGGRGKLSA